MNGEFDKQFVDTNILFYAHDTSSGTKHKQAKTLIQSLWDSRTGSLSIQVLQEFYYVSTRKLARPLPGTEASQIITSLGKWHVHSPKVEDVLGAIRVQERYDISFWDAMIVHSANQLECGILWSEDLNAGQVYQQVRVQNPFEE